MEFPESGWQFIKFRIGSLGDKFNADRPIDGRFVLNQNSGCHIFHAAGINFITVSADSVKGLCKQESDKGIKNAAAGNEINRAMRLLIINRFSNTWLFLF